MKRLIIVYNPRSTRFPEVEREVISRARKLKGWVVLKFEVPEESVQKASEKLSGIIRKDDLVLSAGGDGTATMVLNAILKSEKRATMGAMGFGNFNDFSETLGNESFNKIIKRFEEGKFENFYPLEIKINEKFYGFSGMYFSVGMMAEATRIFEKKKNRKRIRKTKNRLQFVANRAFFWYLKNKRRKDFLPEGVKLNGEKLLKNTTDYLALNGREIASLIPAEGWTERKKVFWSGEMRNRNLFRALKIFVRALEEELPGGETTGDVLEFPVPATVFVHAEGEGGEVRNVKKIEVSKFERNIRVV
ncbi:hypothetical protein IJ380_00305 [Candidatus Saccharibacteria bacterium]|nr:hypothetical protein [Candidatus Saccharibacteria bacterium]